LARHADTDAAVIDLAALLKATGERPYDTVIIHAVPEHWPRLIEAGKRNVGYTVWETDALPSHWLPLLNLPDKVLVPSGTNRTVFMDGGVTPPVTVVPHIRRHSWTEGSAADGVALRNQLGVPQDHFVFYSINVWDPRKALADLVSVFSRAFCADDKVSLVLKTSTAINVSSLERRTAGGIPERIRALQDGIAAETGRPCAHVALIAADGLAGRVVDALHATADCFASLSHGEGWGMGAFDAATLGKPLLIAPYGGPGDYLPADYPGFIDYTMVPVSGWTVGASYQPPQRWAQPDLADAGRKMRRMVVRHSEFLGPAALAAEHIVNRYAEPVVARELIAALDG
jgi:glycosyltransferase involved in cell wall biosynthesis